MKGLTTAQGILIAGALIFMLVVLIGGFLYSRIDVEPITLPVTQGSLQMPAVSDQVEVLPQTEHPEEDAPLAIPAKLDWLKFKNGGFRFEYPSPAFTLARGEIYEGTTLENASFDIQGGGHFEYSLRDNSQNYAPVDFLDSISAQSFAYTGGKLSADFTDSGQLFYLVTMSSPDDLCHFEYALYPDSKKMHMLSLELCTYSTKHERLELFREAARTAQP